MRGATGILGSTDTNNGISIHAPHAGCDSYSSRMCSYSSRFQSTHPMRGATARAIYLTAFPRYFNPRTPCGVRHVAEEGSSRGGHISIHAPHAGCDLLIDIWILSCFMYFNPRTPCGVRPCSTPRRCRASRFQSTHPMRGATETMYSTATEAAFQSTHPMRGATPQRLGSSAAMPTFQSTHPMRGATPLSDALRLSRRHFNPRTPCGVRLDTKTGGRRAVRISIHAPHAGCDAYSPDRSRQNALFQSTHPMRGATSPLARMAAISAISIHAPARGATNGRPAPDCHHRISIHAPARGATCP